LEGCVIVAKRWVVYFDGGSRGNPGPSYGSHALFRDSQRLLIRYQEFGRHTNNEAEYLALIRALEDTLAVLQRMGLDPAREALEVRGDSQLVLSQVRGDWKVREPRLGPLRDRARELLGRFGHYSLVQVPREENVQVLGH
jgi:ribonuclease HI